jgi:CubicO group peptidase (beta-lactamase class C family)
MSGTGIAQQEGLININNKVSQYIGTRWTSEPITKENLITMTSGIND